MTMLDKYGREVLLTTIDDKDVYAVDGASVSFPAGWPQERALATIESMTPAEAASLDELKRHASAEVGRRLAREIARGVLHV